MSGIKPKRKLKTLKKRDLKAEDKASLNMTASILYTDENENLPNYKAWNLLTNEEQ